MILKSNTPIIPAAILCGGWMCAPAFAQPLSGGITITVSNTITPTKPRATIEFWGWFTPVAGKADLFGGVITDVVAAESGWSAGNYSTTPPIMLGNLQPVGGTFNLLAAQLHFPPAGAFGSTANPIHLLSIEWTTSMFDKRTVDVLTDTLKMSVIDQTGSVQTNLPSVGINEGSAKIRVVPSPAPLAVLGLTPLIARRRRT